MFVGVLEPKIEATQTIHAWNGYPMLPTLGSWGHKQGVWMVWAMSTDRG